MYRAPPEVNRICCRAQRDRAYKQHLNALRNIRPSIDTRAPVVPQTIGKNLKRYEIEKQRNLAIQNQNVRLVHRLDRILREEHYAAQPPQRPFTLQGRWQKERYKRITEENEKIIRAVQNSRPILNRNDWYVHQIDHEYQHHKNAEYKPTLPMSDIIKMKEEEIQSARRQRRQNDEDFYEIHTPTQPNTSRNEAPHRQPQHQPPPVQPEEENFEEKHYDVKEPEESTSISGIIKDQIHEDTNEQQNQHEEEHHENMSIKQEIHQQVQVDLHEKETGQQYNQNDMSLKQEIHQQVQEDYNQKQTGEQYQQEENQPNLSIRQEMEFKPQEPQQPQQESGGFSIRAQIHSTVAENYEEKQKGEQYQNTGNDAVYGGQQTEYQEFEPIKPITPPEGQAKLTLGDDVKEPQNMSISGALNNNLGV